MRRVVKRYANRKLYDTTSSRYVALDDVAAFVRRGDEVEVTDNETGEDLTAVTFAQIILEDERKKKSFLSLPVLQELVRYGGDAIADVTHRGIEAFGEIREKAERRVSELVPGARGGRKEGSSPAAIIDDMIENSRRRIDDLQRRVDRGLKDSVNKLRSVPGIGPEVERLESGLKEIEGRLRNLLARADRDETRSNRGGPADTEPPGRSSHEGR